MGNPGLVRGAVWYAAIPCAIFAALIAAVLESSLFEGNRLRSETSNTS